MLWPKSNKRVASVGVPSVYDEQVFGRVKLVLAYGTARHLNHNVDKPKIRSPFPSVSNFQRIFGFLVLAIWLAAAHHCDLEAAGLLDTHPGEGTAPLCCSSNGPCTQDGCVLVERGSFTSSNATVKVPMPLLNECVCLLCAHLVVSVAASEPSLEFARGIDEPLGWVPTWHFERRAAQPPRAPSLIQA